MVGINLLVNKQCLLQVNAQKKSIVFMQEILEYLDEAISRLEWCLILVAEKEQWKSVVFMQEILEHLELATF